MSQRRKRELTQSQQRLLRFLKDIESPEIKEILQEVFVVESRHRSSLRQNFPIREIRDAVDTVAVSIEMKEGKDKNNAS